MPKQTFFNLDLSKQQNIIYSSIQEFTGKGFVNGSIASISKEAVVSKGSLYQYFNDKKELYLYIVDYTSSILNNELKVLLHSVPKETLEDFLHTCCQKVWSFIEKYKVEYLFLTTVQYEQEYDIRCHYKRIKARMQCEVFSPLIHDLQECELIRADLPSEHMLLYINSLITVMSNAAIVDPMNTEESLKLITKEAWFLIMDSLCSLIKNGIGIHL
ncbi:MAG TPA: TetR/AcrR family transcriptional regulator [Lachnospiraceae bacterium]|nr:TetR/AcrR family transcriptional regulator [Lachnospiraceae bacterium]